LVTRLRRTLDGLPVTKVSGPLVSVVWHRRAIPQIVPGL